MDFSRYCIVFGITPNLAFALGTFLVGFLKHHRDWNGSVYVFHNGLSDSDVDNIRRIWPKVSFQLVDEMAVKKRLIGLSGASAAIDQTILRYSTMYFAKFEMFDLLPTYEKCIWFDVDMVTLRPFPEIWDFDDIAWRPVLKRTARKHQDLKMKYSDILDKHPVSRPNAGLICASRNLWVEHGINAQSLYDQFVNILSKKPIVTGDEMSLMLVAAKNRLKLKELPMAYNCPSGTKVVNHACVVHSIGPDKFWNDGGVSAAFPAWRKCYSEWVDSGGSEYSGLVDEDYIPLTSHEIVSSSRRFKNRRAAALVMKDFIPAVLCPDPLHLGREGKFYFAGLCTDFRLLVDAATQRNGSAANSSISLILEVWSDDDARLQSVLEEFRSDRAHVPGFSINEEHLSSGRLELVNDHVSLSSVKDALMRVHQSVTSVAKLLWA